MKKLYLVGGAVRDILLGRTPHDYDFVAVGFSYEEMVSLYGEPVGEGFPVFIGEVPGYGRCEIAMARRERSTGNGYKDFVFEFGEDITLEEDLLRRDFTINAMAMDVETGEIIDPYGGKEDLSNKILRATNPKAFEEDPLRVLRLARFRAKLGFEIERNTFNLAKKMKPKLHYLTKERVWLEIEKALSTSYPHLFFITLKELDVLDIIFPELVPLIDMPQAYHKEDAFTHTMLALSLSVEYNLPIEYRFAVLVHDLGKGTTPEKILPHHYNHEKRGVEVIERLAERLPIPKRFLKVGKFFTENHLKLANIFRLRPSKIARLLVSIHKEHLDLRYIFTAVRCDLEGREGGKEFNIDVDLLERMQAEILKINGKELTKKYGSSPKIGEILLQKRTEKIKEMIR